MIKYQFSAAPMRAEDRMVNPLGFQVTRYRRDAETVPDAGSLPVGTAIAPAGAPAIPLGGGGM